MTKQLPLWFFIKFTSNLTDEDDIDDTADVDTDDADDDYDDDSREELDSGDDAFGRWDSPASSSSPAPSTAPPAPPSTPPTTTAAAPPTAHLEPTVTQDPYFTHFDPRIEHQSFKDAQQRLEETHREKVGSVFAIGGAYCITN